MTAQQTLHLPDPPLSESILRSRKQELKKDLLLWLGSNNLGWSTDAVNRVGSNFVSRLTDCLWYIDGHHYTLDSRACSIPIKFKHLQGYNQSEKSHHRKRDADSLSCTVLDHHSSVLNAFFLQP